MKFTLTIKMDGSAFPEPDELERILHAAHERVAECHPWDERGEGGALRDAHGATVGAWEIEP